MQKAGRSYLNCKYEPATTEQNDNNNNNSVTDYKNSGGVPPPSSSSSSMLNDLQKADDVVKTETEKIIIGKNMARNSPTTPENSREYFKLAPLYWYAIILPALAFTFIVWYRPEWIPINYMPFIGEFAYNLGTKHSNIALLINIGALVAHIGEAIYSLYLCDQLNIAHASSFKWFIQTFLVGFSSLGIDGIEAQRNEYRVCLDAARQTKAMPTLPLFGASRLTCYNGNSGRRNSANSFLIPGQIVIQNADHINGCILQMRVIIADKKDSRGKPIFFDVKILCPNFEPSTAYVNGKQAKMSIQQQ
uniref:Transmembrane protein 254 n=1 Tax=Panagrolaimus superbus TaxID=310955 RepID=A0A914Y4P3_9BILA